MAKKGTGSPAGKAGSKSQGSGVKASADGSNGAGDALAHGAPTKTSKKASAPGGPPPSGPPPGVSPSGKTAKPADLGKDGLDTDGLNTNGRTLKQPAKAAKTAPGGKKPLPKSAPPAKGGKQAGQADSNKLGVDVAVLWRGDMLTAGFFPKPRQISAGPDGSFVVPEDAVGGACIVLVEPATSAGFGLRVDAKQAAGHVIVDGDVHDVADVRDGKVSGLKGPLIPLTGGIRAVLVFGDFTFIISRVPVPPPAKFTLWDRRMLPFLLCWGASFLLTTIPLIMAFNSPEWRNRASLNYQQQQQQRIAELEFIEVKEEEKPKEEEEKEEEKVEEKVEETPIKPEEKKKQEEIREEKEVQKEVSEIQKSLQDLDEDAKAKKVEEMVDTAVKTKTAELDAALAAIDSQAVGTRLFAESDEGEGSTANPEGGAGGNSVIADPTGATAGLAAVAGAKKEDRLGGRSATQRGKIASLEKDKKAGKDVKIGLKARAQKVVRVGGSSRSKTSGELPKKVIKRYIARKMGAIKSCYQKGLQSNPSLQGKVKVKFLIAPTGAVTGVKVADSGLNSPSVENCIVKNIKTWRFPRAKGGGSTMVVYPFVFSRR